MTEVDRIWSVWCSVVWFGISGVEHSHCIIRSSYLPVSFCTLYESVFSFHWTSQWGSVFILQITCKRITRNNHCVQMSMQRILHYSCGKVFMG